MFLVLVLSRKKNQQLLIDENIVITIVEINRDRVKIGIDAPKNIHVYRKEIAEKWKTLQKQKEK